MNENLKKARLEDCNLTELHAAEKAEIVIRDDGTGIYEVMKDRELGEGRKYTLPELLFRLRNGPEDRAISILWLKRI